MAGKRWLKLWTETLHDRKLRRVTPSWRWCWVGLLMLAAETDDAGKLHLAATEPLTDEDIADELGVDLTDWTLARDYFLRIKMLHHEGPTLVVTNYVKRQEPADPTAAERMRRMRDKGRDSDRDVTVTVTDVTRNVTPNVTRTLRVEAEAEVDTEAEGESEQSPAPPVPNGTPVVPVSLVGWTDLLREDQNHNKGAILMQMFDVLFPQASERPTFAYIGKTAKNVGGAGRLAELMWQAAARPPSGDIMAYCAGMAKGGKTNGKAARDLSLDELKAKHATDTVEFSPYADIVAAKLAEMSVGATDA